MAPEGGGEGQNDEKSNIGIEYKVNEVTEYSFSMLVFLLSFRLGL